MKVLIIEGMNHIISSELMDIGITGKIEIELRRGNKGGVSVKKIGIVLFSISLFLAITFILPHSGTSNLMVDDSDSGCLVEGCHTAEFGAEGNLHSVSAHSSCGQCHEGTPELGNVGASSCIECHPFDEAGKCPLVLFHEDSVDYDPPDKSCLECHGNCEGGETTTTTTVTYTTVKGKRYEVFLVGSFEGCSATTMTFRSDNILLLGCIDGYGVYLPILNFFTAVYWAPNFYLGGGVVLVLSGVGLDPFITAGGIAYVGNDVRPLLITGYLLSTPQ